MATLGIGERCERDEATCLRRIVVRDGRLQMLAERDRLPELSPEPAKEADRSLIRHGREASGRALRKTRVAIMIMAR